MNDIPADAAPTTEEPAPPVPPGEPSSAAAAVSAAVAPGEDLLASGSPTEAPPDVSLGAGSAQAEGVSPVAREERLRLVFHKGERLRWRLELVEEHQRGGARLGL